MITLERAMRILNEGEPWTVTTADGEGWIFYYDGETLHDGSRYGRTLDDLKKREGVDIYEREERKYTSAADRRYFHYMELEAGLAFIVSGRESGTI